LQDVTGTLISFLDQYTKIKKSILFVIAAEFFLQLINASFLSILPLYMRVENYSDGEIAGYTKFRYVGLLALSLLVGLYIRGRKLKHLFYMACTGVPAFGILILYSVHTHESWLNYTAQILWGASFTFMQIPVLPFILRNARHEQQTAAISLSYATWSLAGIISSCLISLLNAIDPEFFSEQTLLVGFCMMGFAGLFFISRMNMDEHIPSSKVHSRSFNEFDWGIIARALIPTLIMAVGAGFTIPFISLFFANVHGLSTAQFAGINLVASFLVALASMLVPNVKKGIGYSIAIPTTQSFAIIALILMATTEFYNTLAIAVFIAIGCFLLRQPLMNLAGPMTTEVVMGYSGKKNHEMVSGLTAAIWSGSWFFSGMIFGNMRNADISYVYIFLITAALYTVGVVWYYFLVKEYDKKMKEK
jgi:hypothetical protein